MHKHILYEFLEFGTGCVPYSVMPGNSTWIHKRLCPWRCSVQVDWNT